MNRAFITYEVRFNQGREEESGERSSCWKEDNYKDLQCRESGRTQAVTNLNSLFQLPEILWTERHGGSRMRRQRAEPNASHQKANEWEWLHPDVLYPGS